MTEPPRGGIALPTTDQDMTRHPDHRMLLTYWRARLDGSVAPPLRSGFDPVELAEILPRIAVIEAVDDEGRTRYRYRLAGGEIVARSGRDPTGRFFDQLYEGKYLETASALYDGIRARGEPHFSQNLFPVGKSGKSVLRYDRLILPMRSSDELDRADQFLLLIVVLEQLGDFETVGSFWQVKT